MRLLWILIVSATCYGLQHIIYKRYWNRGLQVLVNFQEDHVYEGESAHLVEEITNNKRMPLPAVEIRFALDRSLTYTGEDLVNASVSDWNYRRDVFSLFSYQKNIRSFQVQCKKRGCYQLKSIERMGHDFFFQTEYYESTPHFSQLYVYPHPVDIRRIGLVHQAITGMQLITNPVYQDPFAFAGIRSYDQADPMNRINWKASAKTGELMVNQLDATTDLMVRCLLDVSDDHIMKYPRLVEESISIATSLATRLTRDHMEVSIISNGEYSLYPADATGAWEPEIRHLELSMHSGSGDWDQLYRTMACIETNRTYCSMEELLMKEAAHPAGHCMYILISHNTADPIVNGIHTLHQAGANLLWVNPQERTMEAIADMLQVKYIRWEVEA